MYTILLSIPRSSKHSSPNEVNWESIHSHFSDLFSDDFICVVKPFNGDHTLAKIYFKNKVSFASRSDELLINNAVPAKVIERKEDPSLPASSSRTIRLPGGCTTSELAEITIDLDEQFRVELQAATAAAGEPANAVTLHACHPEVLDYAEAALRKWVDANTASGGAAATGATAAAGAARPARRPLFPAAFAGADGPDDAANSSASALDQAIDLQRQIGPYDFKLPLGGRCSVRVRPHDITALPCDLIIVSTSCSLSLNYGLARVVAAKCGRQTLQRQCQQRIAQSGNLKFGDTHLVPCPPGAQLPARHLLFLALPNDKRLTESVDAAQFKSVMQDVMARLFKEFARLSADPGVAVRTVAMTPLGASLPYWADLSEDFAHVFARTLWEARARTRDLQRIEICDLQLENLATLGRVLEARFGVRLTPPQPPPSARHRRAPPSESGGCKFDSDNNDEESCEICCEDLSSAANPPAAFHCGRGRLCTRCVRRLQDPQAPGDGRCPICLERYQAAIGTQPAGGNMTVATEQVSLPGHEGCATIVVTYTFAAGVQGPDHPSPGRPYRGASRVTYFPDSPEGRAVVQRLRAAFAGRAVFTVGTSATTGMENTLTWATVHHKTNIAGGPERHGYPDPTYLQRISDELAGLGY